MRKLTILIAFLMAVLFTGTAFASDEQEQLVHEQFGTGSYATWLRDDGTWDNGKPGTDQSTKPHEYSIPAEKLKNYKLTRIEVKTGYSFDPEAFKKAGGWQRISEYDDYADEILRYTPDNLAVTDTHDLATGKVNVTWSLKLNPTFPPENKREARDTVDLNVREQLRQLGFKLEDDEVYADFREGWLWCLPVYIEWYGVPKSQVINLVASSIDPGVTNAEPGKKYTGTVKFKYFGSAPVENVPIGVFNGKYQAVLLKDGQPVTSDNFAPGDIKTYTFNWTAPESGETVLKGVIDTPPLENKYQETTEEDNTVSVTVGVTPPCTDISVTLTRDKSTGEVYAGYEFIMDATVKRANDGPAGPVNVKITLTGPGILDSSTGTITLNQGQSKKVSFFCKASSAKSHTYKATVEPIGVVDCSPGNNVSSYTVNALDAGYDVPDPDDNVSTEIIW